MTNTQMRITQPVNVKSLPFTSQKTTEYLSHSLNLVESYPISICLFFLELPINKVHIIGPTGDFQQGGAVLVLGLLQAASCWQSAVNFDKIL